MVPALVLLGADNRPLRPSIQQNDGRTGEEIAALRARLDEDAFFAATGQPFSQQLIGPKVLWIARHEGAVAGAIRRVLGSYDYVTWRLAGEWSLEQNWALESGLWDARRRDWYRPALRRGRDRRGLARPRARAPRGGGRGDAPERRARRGSPRARRWSRAAPTTWPRRSPREAAPGELVLKIGGAGDVLFAVDRFAPDPRLYIDYHDVPGLFLLNGCMATSGSLVKWLAAECARDLGAGEDAYARLDAEAAGDAGGQRRPRRAAVLPRREDAALRPGGARRVLRPHPLSSPRSPAPGPARGGRLRISPPRRGAGGGRAPDRGRAHHGRGRAERALAPDRRRRARPRGGACARRRPRQRARRGPGGRRRGRPLGLGGRAPRGGRLRAARARGRSRPPGIASATASTGISTRVWRRPSPPREVSAMNERARIVASSGRSAGRSSASSRSSRWSRSAIAGCAWAASRRASP